MNPAPHATNCPDCHGEMGSYGYRCCGGQGCEPRSCWRDCETCEGRGHVDGYRTCDGEIVSASEAEQAHIDREDSECPIEDCAICETDYARAAAEKMNNASDGRTETHMTTNAALNESIRKLQAMSGRVADLVLELHELNDRLKIQFQQLKDIAATGNDELVKRNAVEATSMIVAEIERTFQ